MGPDELRSKSVRKKRKRKRWLIHAYIFLGTWSSQSTGSFTKKIGINIFDGGEKNNNLFYKVQRKVLVILSCFNCSLV